MPTYENPADARSAGLAVAFASDAPKPMPTPEQTSLVVATNAAMPSDEAALLRANCEKQIAFFNDADGGVARRSKLEAMLADYGASPAPELRINTPRQVDVNRSMLMNDEFEPGRPMTASDYKLDVQSFRGVTPEQRGAVAADWAGDLAILGCPPMLASGLVGFLYANNPRHMTENERLDWSIAQEQTAVRKWGAQGFAAKQMAAKKFVESAPNFKAALNAHGGFYLNSWWLVSTLNEVQRIADQWKALKT